STTLPWRPRGARLEITRTENRFAVADQEGIVRVWDWETGKLLSTIPAQESELHAIAISKDMRRIMTAHHSGKNPGMIRIWATDTGEKQAEWPEDVNGILNFVFSPDGTRI